MKTLQTVLESLFDDNFGVDSMLLNPLIKLMNIRKFDAKHANLNNGTCVIKTDVKFPSLQEFQESIKMLKGKRVIKLADDLIFNTQKQKTLSPQKAIIIYAKLTNINKNVIYIFSKNLYASYVGDYIGKDIFTKYEILNDNNLKHFNKEHVNVADGYEIDISNLKKYCGW